MIRFIMKDECVEKVIHVVHNFYNRCISGWHRFLICHRIIDIDVFEKMRVAEGYMQGEIKANHKEMHSSMDWDDESLMYAT